MPRPGARSDLSPAAAGKTETSTLKRHSECLWPSIGKQAVPQRSAFFASIWRHPQLVAGAIARGTQGRAVEPFKQVRTFWIKFRNIGLVRPLSDKSRSNS